MYRSDVGQVAANAVKYAVSKAHYIMIDTAQFYKNETDVGSGLKDSNIPRVSLLFNYFQFNIVKFFFSNFFRKKFLLSQNYLQLKMVNKAA